MLAIASFVRTTGGNFHCHWHIVAGCVDLLLFVRPASDGRIRSSFTCLNTSLFGWQNGLRDHKAPKRISTSSFCGLCVFCNSNAEEIYVY
jgi:hypothetical protein